MAAIGKVFHKNDELYTPLVLANIIVPFIIKIKPKRKKLSVLCPFDTEDGSFYKVLSSFCDVQCAHLTRGRVVKDFFTWRLDELAEYDAIVSNPPFSLKKKIFERLYEVETPFAMVCNAMSLNYHEICDLFMDKRLQIIAPNKRISFDGNPSSFNSVYYCRGLPLEMDNTFVDVPHNNTGKNFVGSYSP